MIHFAFGKSITTEGLRVHFRQKSKLKFSDNDMEKKTNPPYKHELNLQPQFCFRNRLAPEKKNETKLRMLERTICTSLNCLHFGKLCFFCLCQISEVPTPTTLQKVEEPKHLGVELFSVLRLKKRKITGYLRECLSNSCVVCVNLLAHLEKKQDEKQTFKIEEKTAEKV